MKISKADILCIPVTGHGLTMTAYEAALYLKEVEAKYSENEKLEVVKID